MYNFNNLSDFEFEILCKDIMEKKLQMPLRIFQKGRDGGIDITDDSVKKNVVIQVKHYINSKYSDLLSSMKKEIDKVKKLNPKQYYICCAVKLTSGNIRELYQMFSDYMENASNVISLIDINEFLEKPENIDIVRKHYKLWLESTNILGEIMNQHVFIDCESLLYNVEEVSKEFVETKYYYECREILNNERMVLLLGMPGVAKTITTKMLALYYAANGYRIRYTTNGDIKDLKNALSSQKDLKEVLLLDDCLGQHYFKMKETQENELLTLVKYISMNKNKKLIMNSRITIFQQAKERSIEFKQFTEDKKIQIRILDMSDISILDKGRIFHNHIYFKGLPEAYYDDICREQNYRKIVLHKNYTPRIIEFVTRYANYKRIETENYSEYIIKYLENPKEIWNDEFTKRLQQEDRIFMTTLYSLTDTSVDVEIIKRAFNYRIGNSMVVDTTKNIWEDVLKRLEGSMILIVEKNRKKEIGTINPSVNDFLKEYLSENEIETGRIKDNSTEYKQIKRGFSKGIEEIVRAGKAILYNYDNENEEMYVILSFVCKLSIFDGTYQYIVEKFFQNLNYGSFEGMMSRCELFIVLLSSIFDEFYCTRSMISYDELEWFFDSMDLDEYQILISTMKLYDIDFLYKEYGELFIKSLNKVILEYIEYIIAEDYYSNYDIDDLLQENMKYNGYYLEIDTKLVVETIIEWIKEDIEEEVLNKVKDLPVNIWSQIKVKKEDMNMNRVDIESFIDSYYEPSESEYDYHEEHHDFSGSSEIDMLDIIFQ